MDFKLNMKLVEIKNISMTDMGFVLLLKNSADERLLPIFVSSVEAKSISMVLYGEIVARPLTHDLMKNILLKFGYKIDKVLIEKVEENVFYSKICFQELGFLKKSISKSKKNYEIDSRTSDAIALALRFEAPIYVSNDIFENYSVSVEPITPPHQSQAQKQKKPHYFSIKKQEGDLILPLEEHQVNEEEKETMLPSDKRDVNQQLSLYKEMLADAINSEKFEAAAKIRDEIDTLLSRMRQS